MELQIAELSLLDGMEQDVGRRQRDGAMAFLWEHFDRSLALYYRVLTATLERQTDLEAGEGFWEAYFWLAIKCLSNLRTIGIVVERGWHGSAYPLLRSLYSDIAMIWYLHFNPHLVRLWLDELESTYQDSKAHRKEFREATVFGALQDKGAKPTMATFQWLSKSVHASGWGIRFFAQEGRLTPFPFVSSEHMTLVLTTASGMAQDMVQLAMLHVSGNPGQDMSHYAEELRVLQEELNALVGSTAALENIEQVGKGV